MLMVSVQAICTCMDIIFIAIHRGMRRLRW